MAVRWPATLSARCAACGGAFTVPTSSLLSLQAVCPGCGASLADAGRERLTEAAFARRGIDVCLVGIELQMGECIDLTDSEVNAARSLEELSGAVAARLAPTSDREARAAKLVYEAAQRVAPDLLHGEDYEERVVQRLVDWWRERASGS